jgi:hypothetical protein
MSGRHQQGKGERKRGLTQDIPQQVAPKKRVLNILRYRILALRFSGNF